MATSHLAKNRDITVESVTTASPQLRRVLLGNRRLRARLLRRLRRRSRLAQLVGTMRQLAQTNLVTFLALWDAQPTATIVRIGVALTSVVAPVMGWWGSGIMVDALVRSLPFEDLALGAGLWIGSLCALGVIPVALSSFERMSDNKTFELVFGKLTRKMITFNQEQLSDPVLVKETKQVRERAVWRMMSMARLQPLVVRTFGTLLITGCILLVKAPALLALMVAFGLPTIIVERNHALRRADLDEELAPSWGPLWSDLSSMMLGSTLAMLHTFGAATWFARRYRTSLKKLSETECKLESDAATGRALAALLVGVGVGISVVALALRTRAGALSIGEFVLITGAIASIATGLAEAASLLGQQLSQSRSIRELLDLLNKRGTESISTRLKPIDEEYRLTTRASLSLVGGEKKDLPHLEFQDVRYRYPSAEENQYAIRDISFSIKRGSVVAVVGPNGAGKSSTMGLMLRQLTPSSGRILIEGQDVAQMSGEEFASEVVMLPQQIRHFNLPARDLLNLGRVTDPASDEFLYSELERTGAAEFVRKWANGLDTILGVEHRKAIEPSGGQLQRLLLASVVICQRGLIVLDEPVSMVDPDAARQFWDALFSEAVDRTVIFSTHHFGAVRRADKILLIEDGVVAAEGTHDELMLSSARYRGMFEAQAKDFQ